MSAERRTRVLLVEDDRAARYVCALALRHLGFEVETAVNGAEALEAVDLLAPDVILLDLLMPTMDGFMFMRLYDGKVPIIVMSGWTDFKELPYEPYAKFIKPTGMSEIAPTLREAAAKLHAVAIRD